MRRAQADLQASRTPDRFVLIVVARRGGGAFGTPDSSARRPRDAMGSGIERDTWSSLGSRGSAGLLFVAFRACRNAFAYSFSNGSPSTSGYLDPLAIAGAFDDELWQCRSGRSGKHQRPRVPDGRATHHLRRRRSEPCADHHLPGAERSPSPMSRSPRSSKPRRPSEAASRSAVAPVTGSTTSFSVAPHQWRPV